MKDKISLALNVLFGLLFINSGLNKFLNYMPMPEMPENMMKMMGSMMEIGWLLPVVAVGEIIGGLLLFSKKYRALGAIILFPIILGIVATHIAGGTGLPLALLFAAVLLWIMFNNRDKYLALIE